MLRRQIFFKKNTSSMNSNALNIAAEGQFINCGTVLDWNYTQAGTIMAAIKLSTAPHSGGAAVISTHSWAAPYTTWPELWINSSGTLQVRAINNFGKGNYFGVYGAKNVCDGNWHMVAMTYTGNGDASGVNIYVDGVEDTLTVEMNSLSGSTVSGLPMTVGNQNGLPYQIGEIGFYAISNIARSVFYIQSYSWPSLPSPVDSNTSLYYDFSEGSGSTAHDLSGNSYNGIIEGAPAWVAGPPIPTHSVPTHETTKYNTGTNVESLSVIFSTNGANRLIFATAINTTASVSISDTARLTWVQRAQTLYGGSYLVEWVAEAPEELINDVVTITASSGIYELVVNTFYKTNGAPPSLPQSPATSERGVAHITTMQTLGLIFANIATSNITPTSGAGWSQYNGNDYCLVEGQSFNAPGTFAPTVGTGSTAIEGITEIII